MKNTYPLSLIRSTKENGIIEVTPNITQSYRIEIADYFGNITKVFIPIQYGTQPVKVAEIPVTSSYVVKAKKESIFALDNATVTFPPNTFLDDFT